MTAEAKRIFIDYIRQANGEDIKDFILAMAEDMDDSLFLEGHDNGYDDGNGKLQDIWVNNLMFDCRIDSEVTV